MGAHVTAEYSGPELSARFQRWSITAQKFLCNYDETGDGIDDRYQTKEYEEETDSHETEVSNTHVLGGPMSKKDSDDLVKIRKEKKLREQAQIQVQEREARANMNGEWRRRKDDLWCSTVESVS